MSSAANSPSADDRFGLTQLVIRYASAVDDRDFAAVGALFATDGELVAGSGTPRRGREAIVAAMQGIERYDSTFHHLGQIHQWIDQDGAVQGAAYCIAHHFTAVDGGTSDRVMYIRYADTFTKVDDQWLFARRELATTWAGQEDKMTRPV